MVFAVANILFSLFSRVFFEVGASFAILSLPHQVKFEDGRTRRSGLPLKFLMLQTNLRKRFLEGK